MKPVAVAAFIIGLGLTIGSIFLIFVNSENTVLHYYGVDPAMKLHMQQLERTIDELETNITSLAQSCQKLPCVDFTEHRVISMALYGNSDRSDPFVSFETSLKGTYKEPT